MRHIRFPAYLCVIIALLIASPSIAAEGDTTHVSTPTEFSARPLHTEAFVLGIEETHYHLVIPKDPVLAAFFSIAVPGSGHMYTGKWVRGAVFMGSFATAVTVIGLGGSNLGLDIEDFDDPARGGNGDGKIDFDEHKRWNERPYRDFSELSTTRKAVVIGGIGAAVGVYVWNVIDAYHVAKEHNRQIFSRLSGVQVGMGVDRCGRTVAQVRIPL